MDCVLGLFRSTRSQPVDQLIRNQFGDYAQACEQSGFVEYLRRYRTLYSIRDRVLVVREGMARRHTGLGIQTSFMLKWLLLGMALKRPVYFQYCGSFAEPWAQRVEDQQGPSVALECTTIWETTSS